MDLRIKMYLIYLNHVNNFLNSGLLSCYNEYSLNVYIAISS